MRQVDQRGNDGQVDDPPQKKAHMAHETFVKQGWCSRHNQNFRLNG